MHYPPKFSNKARAAVEAELIRAGRLHDERKRQWKSDWSFPERQSLATCILNVFLTYAREAIELGKSGVWKVDQVRQEALEGLRLITIEVSFKRDYHLFIERNGGSISSETQREFEATTEWHRFEEELLALAEQQAVGARPVNAPAKASEHTRTTAETDLDVFQAPSARAKEAEALAILAANALPARKMLDDAKRGYGQFLPTSELGVFISPAAEENYKQGKRGATRLLFDSYAAIIFPRVPDAEGFIAALSEVAARVKTTLGVIDGDEAELCRLAWERKAWERAQPTWLGGVWRNLQAHLKRGTTNRKVLHNPAEEPVREVSSGDDNSSQVNARGTMTQRPSWKYLQADFLQYAVEHLDLRAVWRWMYEDPDESAEPTAPKGQWTLEGGSPGSQHLFRVIARRAASQFPNPSAEEPWRLWLDRMRAEGYTRDLPPRRVSMQHVRNLGELGLIGRPLPPGFKNQHIEQVFRASADFCLVCSLAELNTAPHSPVADGPGDGQPPGLRPPAGVDLTEAVGERAARRQAVVNPILERKRWKPGRLATEAGVGKNSVYDYLDGTRATITDENRRAIAEALGLKSEELPE